MNIRTPSRPLPAAFPPSAQRLRPLAVLGLALLLGACAHQDYDYGYPPDSRRPTQTQQPPVQRPPVRTPSNPTQTIKALPSQRSTQRSSGGNHPRYAPPPHADAYWDNQLGVYVVKGQPLYYRERLYYRWNDGWYSSGRPNGPWESIEGPGVPPGLRRRYPLH